MNQGLGSAPTSQTTTVIYGAAAPADHVLIELGIDCETEFAAGSEAGANGRNGQPVVSRGGIPCVN